jgi:hypothetical protein
MKVLRNQFVMTAIFIFIGLIAAPSFAAKDIMDVIVDDDFTGQSDVDAYNTAHGTSYTWGVDAFADIPDGIDALTKGNVYVLNGTYSSPVNIEAHDSVRIVGESQAGTIFKPGSVINWDVGTYGASRQTAVRVVGSVGIVFENLTMDFDLIKSNNRSGILYWNSGGEISGNLIQNMSVSDASGGYTEITCYLRAPDFTDTDRAQILVEQNSFLKTGRLAIVAHDYVNINIMDNYFNKVDEDFGYGIELGSMATGEISNNTFRNFATWAATDNSVAAAIYVENSFTYDIVDPIEKPVLIENNDISMCQYGIYVGNEFDGVSVTAGNVDIIATIKHNTVDSAATSIPTSWASGGVVFTDEGSEYGSSVNVVFDSNDVSLCDDYGILIKTMGDGDITALITNNSITGNILGVRVAEYTKALSIFNLSIYHNFFDNSVNAYDDAAGGYWDDGASVGNCWMDFEENSGYPGSYNIYGNAHSVDRYPNVDCGEACDCIPGENDGIALTNIFDITNLINYLYREGPIPVPYETCSGDPDCNCTVNIFDITYLITFLYRDGPAPCDCNDWVAGCGWPPRGKLSATDENIQDKSNDPEYLPISVSAYR